MSNQLALIKKNVVDVVMNKIREFQNNKEISFPPDYSPENAMKSAWLTLQKTLDKDKKPVLSVCTQDSIANALLDMVVQGLNPAKNQGYFIAYGKQLVFQRSYFGAMLVCKTLCGAKDIFSQVVWENDEFEYEIIRGNKSITKHGQKLENIGKNPRAAYCIISFPDGREYTDIMTIDQIKKSWTKSKMNPNADSSTHKQFPEEMIKRTVINRACKKYINSSSDKALLVERYNRADDIIAEVEFSEEVEQIANQELIDIDLVESANPNELTDEEKQAIIEQEMAEAENGPRF